MLQGLTEFCLQRRSIFYPKTDLYISDEQISTLRAAHARTPSVDAIAEVCNRFFGRNPASVEWLTGVGTFHRLYRVAFSEEEAYIVRTGVFGEDRRAFEFFVDDWIAKTLGRRMAPIVPVYWIDLSRAYCSFDYEIVGAAAGVQLKQLEDPDTQAVDPQLLFELGCLVAHVHAVETDGFGLLDIRSLIERPHERAAGVFQTWQEYLLLNLDQHVRVCLKIGAIDQQEGANIRCIFDHAASHLPVVASHLLHGDLGHHNILTDGERITAIIDWEDCLCGDPVFDIAYWGTFCRDIMREPFLEGYRTIRELPEDFETRYWLYYLRVALSKTVHRHLFRYQDHPGRPPASLRIQKGLERLRSFGWG